MSPAPATGTSAPPGALRSAPSPAPAGRGPVGGPVGGPGLRRRWTRAFVIGELVGFLPPAITGATLAAWGAPDVVLVAGLTLAGCLEGGAIGIAQARVLARHAPALDGR